MTNPLPTAMTSFIGRDEELARIADLLADPDCRLLTLVGSGGIGKTRLALQAAQQQFPHFSDGVYFVPLTGVGSSDLLPAAIAGALAFSFYSPEDVRIQIIRYLSQKQMLLVLDNFEHLLEGVDLLTDILQASAGIKLLVTSRERLSVQEEWGLTLEGLAFPDDHAAEALESYSAAQLFVQRARQAQANFSLKDNVEAVKSICQRVEGMPLALELAASWLRAMSCSQIAAQMENDLDILTTPLRNIPGRHRSMRAVFEQSWDLLAADEQDVLIRLSVFRGGFDLEASEEIARAGLAMLASLADKSLVRVGKDGRYDLHELLRQYAADRLAQAGEVIPTRNRHLEYFLKLAEQAEAHVWGREQIPWFDRLEVELDNLRTAFTWSLEGGEAKIGLRLAVALGSFWNFRAHHEEGFAWLERLLAAAQNAPPSIRAKALALAGTFLGRGDRAMALCTEALALARQINDPWNIAWALTALGYCTDLEHILDKASLQEESLALFRELDDPYGLGQTLTRRAWVAVEQRDYSYARTLLDEALIRVREMDDKNATAWVLNLLGYLLFCQNYDLRQAVPLFEESVSLFREIGDGPGAETPLTLLARVEQVAGHEARAQALYAEALVVIRKTRIYEDGMFSLSLAGLGTLAVGRDQPTRAARLLAAAANVTTFDSPVFSAITFVNQVASVRAQLGEAAFAAAWADGEAMTSEQAVAYALEDVTALVEIEMPIRAPRQPLDEPLSVRELEVLNLMSEGLTNAEIAHKLFIALGTVKVHAGNIFGKLGVSNRTEAVARARDLGLLL